MAFPGGIALDQSSERLFIADTSNHRIIVAHLETGRILQIIGNGEPGMVDGTWDQAQLQRPHGLAFSPDDNTLYVADTGNHALRSINFNSGKISVLAGTGQQGTQYPPLGGIAPDLYLSSPWDVELVGEKLYVAMAGSHQIWEMDLTTRHMQSIAGNGHEGTKDGPAQTAELAQPSGLSFHQGKLFFVDTEASSVRWVDLTKEDPEVWTLLGSGETLFDFGDVDGIGKEARLQHPTGITSFGEKLYVADSYNAKLKQVDANGKITTIAGSKAGWRDGSDALFYEPAAVAATSGRLYIADTNNHAIRVLDLKANNTYTLRLWEAPLPNTRRTVISYPEIHLAPGPAQIHLDIVFPPGFRLNLPAPSSIRWSATSDVLVPATGEKNLDEPHGHMYFDLLAGVGTLLIDIDLNYCHDESQVCILDWARLEVPFRVDTGSNTAQISYTVEPPDLPSSF